MERTYRYVLAGPKEEVQICARCGNERQQLKTCEHCGCDYTFVLRYKGEKVEETTLSTVRKVWRKEEITHKERSLFIEDSHGFRESSKYPARVSNAVLKEIRQHKTYLARILFGGLIKTKYQIDTYRTELKETCSNGIFDEIIEKYFSKDIAEMVKTQEISSNEARRKVLSTLADRLKDKKISADKLRLYVNHIKKVRQLNDALTDAIKGKREELSRVSGKGFYDAIIGVYFVREMNQLLKTKKSDGKYFTAEEARDEILKTLNDELPKKIGPKAGAIYTKYIELIQSLSEELSQAQLTAAAKASYYRCRYDGLYSDEFEDQEDETVYQTDLSFIQSTGDEIQAGDVLLAVDAMPGPVRQISDASDCWYFTEGARKLFKVVDPLTQVYETNAWGYDSANRDGDVPYKSVVRSYMEDVLHIREDIEDSDYVDMLGEVFDITRHESVSGGKSGRIQYAGYITDIADTETVDDEDGSSKDDDISEVTYNPMESHQLLPALPQETQVQVDKFIEEYEDFMDKVSENTNLTTEQKDIIRSSAIQELEKNIDRVAGDELTLRFDSPYLGFGYSAPRQSYQFIDQREESNLSNDKEERIKLFFTMSADIMDSTAFKKLYEHKPGKKRDTYGTLSYEYSIYKKLGEQDFSLNMEWTEEKRAQKRAADIIEWRNKGIDEETIRRNLWYRYDKEREKHGVKKDCRWLQDKTKALRNLNFKSEHRSNVFKFRELADYRIRRNREDMEAALRWANKNPSLVNTNDMYRWLRPIVERALQRREFRFYKNMCWMSQFMIPMLVARENEKFDVDIHRVITKQEANKFVNLYNMIDDSTVIADLDSIIRLMNKRTYLTITDEPVDGLINTPIGVCVVTNKICQNDEPCMRRTHGFRTTYNQVRYTQRFQLLNCEEVGEKMHIDLDDYVDKHPKDEKIFGVGPSFSDILTPMEEMYLLLMIASKKDFIRKRIVASNQLDGFLKEEIETELPEAHVYCNRANENIQIPRLGEEDTNADRRSQCLRLNIGKPTFGRIKGNKGHLLLRCERCRKRIWLLSEEDRAIDIKTLEELDERQRK